MKKLHLASRISHLAQIVILALPLVTSCSEKANNLAPVSDSIPLQLHGTQKFYF